MRTREQSRTSWTATSPSLALGAALLLAVAAGCGAETDRFASAPYVQNVTRSSAVVALVTDRPSRMRVEVRPEGATSAAPVRAVDEPEPTTVHGVTVEGLDEDRGYTCLVLDADTGAPLGTTTVHTYPAPGGREVVFAAFGDSGQDQREIAPWLGSLSGAVDTVVGKKDPGPQADLARRILTFSPDAVLHMGDLVYPDGARARYAESLFRPFAPLLARSPFYAIAGNHDLESEGGRPFDEVFHSPANGPERSDRWYSFDLGDVHVSAIDGMTPGALEPGGVQLTWLRQDLASTPRAWKVAYVHEPPFTEGHGVDDAGLQANLVPLLEEMGVHVCFSGSEHNYQRFRPVKGVTYVVTGGGGKSLYKAVATERAAHVEMATHFVLGRASAKALRLEAVDLTGRVFDAVTIAKDR